MSKRRTRSDEPSKASLEEMPEIDFSKMKVIGRGRHYERARRSLEVIVLDKKLVKKLGGPEGVRALLTAVAGVVGVKKSGSRRSRRAA
jgi:hypothetical protein